MDAAVEAAIISAKGKNAKAIKALLDLTKAELADDGTIKGIPEQMEALIKAEDSKFLFDTETKRTNIKGAKPSESTKGNEEGVDTSKMSYSELAMYMAANPDVTIE